MIENHLNKRPLILASTSRYRRALMDQLGVPYQALAPAYEEEHDLPLPPQELVVALARKKAQSLKDQLPPDALIIGSDQVAEFEGEILFKPQSVERCEAQLAKLSGKVHRLLTGVAVYDNKSQRMESCLDIHHMHMRTLSTEEIRNYVAAEQPLDCAGSYKIEGPGIALFSSMKGEDYTGIVGLPLTRVVDLLLRFLLCNLQL